MSARFIQDFKPRDCLNDLDKLNANAMARALPDYLRSAAGLPIKNPKNADLIRELQRDDFSLERFAREISPTHRSVNSSDFAAAMGAALTQIIADHWTNLSARLDAFTRVVEVSTYRPESLLQFDFPPISEVETEEEAPVKFSAPSVSATATGTLKSYETKITVSRQLWATHGAALATATSDYAFAAHRLELRLLSDLLVSNPLLSDNAALFDASNSNSAAFSLSALDAGMSALQSNALTPAALLVAPGKSATINTTLRQAGFDWPVVASASLPAGSWYLFSNPVEHGSILRLREKGSSRAPSVGWVNIDSSGRKGFYASCDMGFSAISRNGIYRGGV